MEERFRTAKNTLEAKQFFKSKRAIKPYIAKAIKQKLSPPYKYLLVVDIDEDCLYKLNVDEQELDDFDALTVYKDELPDFNNCINFTEYHVQF